MESDIISMISFFLHSPVPNAKNPTMSPRQAAFHLLTCIGRQVHEHIHAVVLEKKCGIHM